MDIQSTTNEIGGNVGPEIGECQEEIRFQGEDLVDVRGREGARPRLLAASLRRAHGVTGDPDDAVPLAEQIQRFNGFLGEANNSARRDHQTLAYPIRQTPPPTTARPGTQPIPKISAAPDLFQMGFKRSG
jgi:hypothetical protein